MRPPLDIQEGSPSQSGPRVKRPYLEVYFRCANFYQRVYRNAGGTHYQARCPRCGKTIRFAVGSGGTAQRRFEVQC